MNSIQKKEKEIHPRYIIVKLMKTKDNINISRGTFGDKRERNTVGGGGKETLSSKSRTTAYISTQTKARRQTNDIFKF